MLLENCVFSRVPRMSHPPVGVVGGLDDHGRRHVSEDEMAVAIAEVQVRGGDLRVDHQHGAGVPGRQIVGRGLDAERRRRTGDIHVEPEALDAQRLLHLDRHGRIGALHVGGGADDRADGAGRLVPPRQGVSCGLDRDLGQDRNLLVWPFGNARAHDRRVNHAALVDDVARHDPRRLLDELDGGGDQGLHATSFDFRAMLAVELRRHSG